MKVGYAPRAVRWGAVMFGLIVLATMVSAQNVPIGKSHDITLRAPAQVGESTLPAGTYRVTHVMENENHILVFKGVRGDKKEYRINCKMRELPTPAAHDEQRFEEPSPKERILTSLVFAGDKVEHVF